MLAVVFEKRATVKVAFFCVQNLQLQQNRWPIGVWGRIAPFSRDPLKGRIVRCAHDPLGGGVSKSKVSTAMLIFLFCGTIFYAVLRCYFVSETFSIIPY